MSQSLSEVELLRGELDRTRLKLEAMRKAQEYWRQFTGRAIRCSSCREIAKREADLDAKSVGPVKVVPRFVATCFNYAGKRCAIVRAADGIARTDLNLDGNSVTLYDPASGCEVNHRVRGYSTIWSPDDMAERHREGLNLARAVAGAVGTDVQVQIDDEIFEPGWVARR